MHIFLAALILAVSLNGCVTTVSAGEPDYAGIEFGSFTNMTLLVNEVHVAEDVTVRAYDRLLVLQNTLECIECPPMSYNILESLLNNALPIEYKELVFEGLWLTDNRLRLYAHKGMATLAITDMGRKVALSVVTGMTQAFLQINGDI